MQAHNARIDNKPEQTHGRASRMRMDDVLLLARHSQCDDESWLSDVGICSVIN